MNTYNSLFEQELKKLIELEIERIALNLTMGMGVNDISEYKLQVGQILSLRRILDMCDEVNQIIANK